MLERLYERPRAKGLKTKLDLVIIPAIGLAQPTEWVGSSGTLWYRKLVDDLASQADIWSYVHSHNSQGSVAQRLLAEGPVLLESLHEHCTQVRSEKVPLIFICHGTGAFILKKALCISRDQHFQYRPVIDVVSGAIFLGSPHFGGDISAQDAKKTIDLLLKCQHKGIGRSLSSDNDVAALIEVCRSFELVNLKVPVISAYETKETSNQKHMFSKIRRGKNPIIVTKEMARLKASNEIVVGCEDNHFDICKVAASSSLYEEAEKLIKEVMENAPQRILETTQPYTIPAGLENDTLRSPSTVGYTMIEEQMTLSQRPSFPVSSPRGAATGGSTAGSFEMVNIETALETDSRDPTLPCFSLGTHEKPKDFTGREDVLQTMDDHLLNLDYSSTLEKSLPTSVDDEQNNLRSFALCGLGGMGKTNLALHYAYTRKHKFDAVFWLGADDAKILAQSFAQIAKQLGLEDDCSDFAASRDLVMGWLSLPLKQTTEPESPENLAKWLIIFDNVDNFDVLDDYWPKFGHGSVLITSRDPFAKHNMYIEEGLDLPTLSLEQSEALMQRLTRVRADSTQQSALSEIAALLDGLPLAINQMAGIFRRLRLSYPAFLKFYQEEGIEKLLEKQAYSTNSQKVRSLATVWALDTLQPGTRALLQVICLLDPDEIPEELLIDKNQVVMLAHYPKSYGEYIEARSELLSTSLISQSEKAEKLSLHRLIQDTAKSSMGKEELIAAFQAVAELILSAWPFQSIEEHHSIARFPKCEKLFPSVLRFRTGTEQLFESSQSLPLDIRIAKLFNDTGWYMFERGLPEETRPFCDIALRIGEGLLSTSEQEAIVSIRETHQFLGIALVETNEHGASMQHKKKWLDMLLERKSDGGPIEDYELGYAYNEIGVAYGNVNKLDDAAKAFLRSIEVFQGLNDYEDTMLGWPEPNLGFIYWLQGRLDEAEQALVEILDIHATAYGIDDTKSFKTGKILYGMGNVLEAQERFDESFNFHCRAFEQFKKCLGMNHHRIGDICHKMAGHFMRQGLYSEAEEYMNTSIKIFGSRAYCLNELARSTFKKGELYQLMGKKDDATKLLRHAYQMRRQLQPQDIRPLDELRDADFDLLVTFWSR